MYCPSENDSINTSQAKPLLLITCGKVVFSGAEQFGTILVSLASSPPASDESSSYLSIEEFWYEPGPLCPTE